MFCHMHHLRRPHVGTVLYLADLTRLVHHLTGFMHHRAFIPCSVCMLIVCVDVYLTFTLSSCFFFNQGIMTFGEGRAEYSALLEQTNEVRRQYHSFPRPHALPEDEGPSTGAKAKHQLLLFAENVRSCGERLLAAFRATTSPQDEASSTLLEYEDLACLGRVCAMVYVEM